MKSTHVILTIGLSMCAFILGFGLATGIPVFGLRCNIAMIPLTGALFASQPLADVRESGQSWVTSDWILSALRDAEKNHYIRGIILNIDSGGGESIAGEEIAEELVKTTKPTVALVRSIGTSAAYWASLGADRIIASKNSYVGSIGVTYSYLDAAIKNQKEGLTLNLVQSAEFKGLGNENKSLTNEEREIVERDVKIMHDNFIDEVSAYRGLSKEDVVALADGAPVLGTMAREKGLVDEIGGIEEARLFLEKEIGHAEICYQSF